MRENVQVITTPETLHAVSNVLSSPPPAHNILSMELVYIPLSEEQGEARADETHEQGEEGQPSWPEELVEVLKGFPDCVRVRISRQETCVDHE
jgi:hypothetical protein